MNTTNKVSTFYESLNSNVEFSSLTSSDQAMYAKLALNSASNEDEIQNSREMQNHIKDLMTQVITAKFWVGLAFFGAVISGTIVPFFSILLWYSAVTSLISLVTILVGCMVISGTLFISYRCYGRYITTLVGMSICTYLVKSVYNRCCGSIKVQRAYSTVAFHPLSDALREVLKLLVDGASVFGPLLLLAGLTHEGQRMLALSRSLPAAANLIAGMVYSRRASPDDLKEVATYLYMSMFKVDDISEAKRVELLRDGYQEADGYLRRTQKMSSAWIIFRAYSVERWNAFRDWLPQPTPMFYRVLLGGALVGGFGALYKNGLLPKLHKKKENSEASGASVIPKKKEITFESRPHGEGFVMRAEGALPERPKKLMSIRGSPTMKNVQRAMKSLVAIQSEISGTAFRVGQNLITTRHCVQKYQGGEGIFARVGDKWQFCPVEKTFPNKDVLIDGDGAVICSLPAGLHEVKSTPVSSTKKEDVSFDVFCFVNENGKEPSWNMSTGTATREGSNLIVYSTIQPGSSGGPVFDMDGVCVGIVYAESPFYGYNVAHSITSDIESFLLAGSEVKSPPQEGSKIERIPPQQSTPMPEQRSGSPKTTPNSDPSQGRPPGRKPRGKKKSKRSGNITGGTETSPASV